MNRKNLRRTALLVLIMLPLSIFAQRERDTLALFQSFNRICSGYQHVPLQLSISVTNSSNIVTEQKDTLRMKGEIEIQANSAYFNMNQQEEIFNDSMILVVDRNVKRFFLSFQKNPGAENLLKSFLQSYQSDSSVENLVANYRITDTSAGNGNSQFHITSKGMIDNTTICKEEISVVYHPSAKEIVKVISVMRRLYPLTEEAYNQLSSSDDTKQMLVKGGETSERYIIKESRSTVNFESIGHQKQDVSRSINTYLIKLGDNYQPNSDYKDYAITISNQPY